jgi:hypothetical protein
MKTQSLSTFPDSSSVTFDRVSSDDRSALENCLALSPYSPDSDIVLDDNALIDERYFSDEYKKTSASSVDLSSSLIAAGTVATATYVVTQTSQSKAVTAQITTMVTDLATIVTTIVGLSITVLTVYYAFRITGRLMP